MTGQVIICPNCKTEIPLTEAISHQIREQLQKEFMVESRKRDEELKQRSESLDRKERELQSMQETIDDIVRQKLVAERPKLEESARRKAEDESSLRVRSLTTEIEEAQKKLRQANTAELQLRKEKRDLEDGKRNLELDVARRVDAERESIRRTAIDETVEKHKLRERESEETRTSLRARVDELQRKLDQGPQQLQGEVLELDLEEMLRTRFLLDKIEPVPKGMSGADVVQKVYTAAGLFCGTIIWESKRTKNWSDGWLDKLKDDQRAIGAEIAIIVSTTLPQGMRHFEFLDGVWVTDTSSAYGVAAALRAGLVGVATAKVAAVGKNEKMEMLYSYLTGTQFRQKVEAVVETYAGMKTDLDQEKRAIMKSWGKRQKQIERVVGNVSTMYGELQAIAGASLPEIPQMDLKVLASGEVSEESEKEESVLDLPF